MAQVNLGHVVGPGVPSGGTAGQVLKKNSSTNFDASWVDPDTLPEVNAPVLDLAAAYNASTVYQEGARCTKDGNFYKRKSWGADTPVAEAWTAAHWDQITVSSELDAEATARAAADASTNQAIAALQGSEIKDLDEIADLDNVAVNSVCITGSSTLHKPTNDGNFVVFTYQMNYNGYAFRVQYATETASNNTGRVYTRVMWGTWKNWAQLALKSDVAADWNSISSWCESIESGATTYILKFGRMRTITFQGLARSHTEDEVLMTIPQADRPLATIFGTGNIGSIPVTIKINSGDGKVSLYTANGAGVGRIYFSYSYVSLG